MASIACKGVLVGSSFGQLGRIDIKVVLGCKSFALRPRSKALVNFSITIIQNHKIGFVEVRFVFGACKAVPKGSIIEGSLAIGVGSWVIKQGS